MKLNCKRIDFTYTPGEEIFNFPEESGLPFIFDVEEELTSDPAVMDAVGESIRADNWPRMAGQGGISMPLSSLSRSVWLSGAVIFLFLCWGGGQSG